MVVRLMRIGEICNALQVFDEMLELDIVLYTVLIDGFVRIGYYEQALEWFQRMQMCGINSDHVTIVSAFSTCTYLGVVGLGVWVHRVVLDWNTMDSTCGVTLESISYLIELS